MKKILIVDDNKYLRDGLTIQLRAKLRNCQVLTAENGQKAITVLETEPVDLLLTELRMADMDGFKLIERAQLCCPSVPVYVMTSADCPSLEQHALHLGARQCITKPLSFARIVQFISQELHAEVVPEGSAPAEQAAVFPGLRSFAIAS